MTQIKWNVTAEDADLIQKICERAEKNGLIQSRDFMGVTMDITACHLNGTPLLLADWLAADEFNFSHDLFGIRRHIDRSSGQITNCFLPRFAK